MCSHVLFVVACLLTLGSSTHERNREHVDHAPVHPSHATVKQPHYFEDGTHNVEYDHEAILGSRIMDKEFAQLSPQDAKLRLAKLVDKMDVDSNGYISKDELIEWVVASFKSLDEEEAFAKLQKHDRNNDNNVTWAEYLESVYGYLPNEVLDYEHDKNPQVKVLGEMILLDKEKFESADVNKDGVLDKDEYAPFMYPYDYEHMHAVELKRVMRDYDRNNDGMISLKEYRQEEDFPHDRNREADLVDKENFEAFDVDKNGQMDLKEIRVWALPSQYETAEDEAMHLIEAADKNNDGHLSKHEILANHRMFVDSAVTEYGEYLHDINEL